MLNNVVLVGRLTKDVELQNTKSEVAYVRFTLAVNRPFTNQSGEREADFINCIAWRKTAESMANFLHKGSLIGITGAIQTSNFEGKDGNRVFMTEVKADNVQFLEPRKENQNQQGMPAQQQQQSQQSYQKQQPSYQQNNNENQGYQSQQPNQYQPPQQQQQSYAGNNGGGQSFSQNYSDDDLPF